MVLSKTVEALQKTVGMTGASASASSEQAAPALSHNAVTAIAGNLESRGAELMAKAREKFKAAAKAATEGGSGEPPGDEDGFVFGHLVRAVLEAIRSADEPKRSAGEGDPAAKHRRTD